MHFKTNSPGFKIGNFFLQGLASLNCLTFLMNFRINLSILLVIKKSCGVRIEIVLNLQISLRSFVIVTIFYLLINEHFGPMLFFVGSLLLIDSFFLVIGLFRLSISSRISFGSVYLPRNLFSPGFLICWHHCL